MADPDADAVLVDAAIDAATAYANLRRDREPAFGDVCFAAADAGETRDRANAELTGLRTHAAESRRLLTAAAAVLAEVREAEGGVYDIHGHSPKVSADDAPGLNYLGGSALYLPDAAEQLADMIRKHLETKP